MSECKPGGKHDFQHVAGIAVCQKCGMRALMPHPGPQEKFLRTKATVALFGGAKGGGKSYSLLLDTTRHLSVQRFGAVIFRRESPQIYNMGGLWDTSEKVYPNVGGVPVKSRGEWVFPQSSCKVKFSHLENESNVRDWDGQQVPMIGFDEVTAFTEKQFLYMFTINRSTCGVKPYIRGTCNPDADSWVAKWLEWWINPTTGFPILERSGVIRYFSRIDERLEWGDSWEDLHKRFPDAVSPPRVIPDGITEKRIKPISFTFIPAKLEDNPTLAQADPTYRANLMGMEKVERERFLLGNWLIRPAAGLKFPRDKWRYYPAPPIGLRYCRFWDKAGTAEGKGARTAGALLGELDDARVIATGLPKFWIVHVEAQRWGDAERESKIKSQAVLDNATYGSVTVGMEQEPGSGGKHSSFSTITNLAGFDVFSERPTTNKSARWTPLASQQQVGNVAIVQHPSWDWASFVRELDALAGDEQLDKGKLKDCADAASGSFKYLAPAGGGSVIQGDLIASGDEDFLDEEHGLFSDEEKEELPEFWKELIEETDKLDDDRGRGGRTSWERDD